MFNVVFYDKGHETYKKVENVDMIGKSRVKIDNRDYNVWELFIHTPDGIRIEYLKMCEYDFHKALIPID